MDFLLDSGPVRAIHLSIMSAVFAVLALEMVLAFLLRRKLFNSTDTWVNLKMYLGYSVVMFGFTTASAPILYELRFLSPFRFGHPMWMHGVVRWEVWLVLFVMVDFLYYVMHLVSHRTQAAWSTHVGHHNSQKLNLSTGLRQPWIPIWPLFIWFPLSALGFEPTMVMLVASLNLKYQIFLHTELIPRLGPLEWIFNTPSHHRVHHASNAPYVDRNLGGVLIIWDRMFGTFAKETEKPVYGIGDGDPHTGVLKNSFGEWWNYLQGRKAAIGSLGPKE
jgi:sterol desaturase/sphingolipid hydroxylase (fatty acid hydroxylase superfamily)